MEDKTKRRKFLATVGTVGIIGVAGCTGSGGNNSGSGGNNSGSGGNNSGNGGNNSGSSSNGSSNPIKIGTNFPLSGGNALVGKEATHGVEIFVKEMNNNGGIDGRQIKLFKKDAKDSDAGASNVKSLSTSENVDVIVGSFSSSVSQASVQAASRYDQLYWETTAFSPKISEPGYQNFYHCNPRTTQYGAIGGSIINSVITPQLDTNQPRVGVMYENGVFGTATKNFVKKQADKYSYNVVESIGYPPFETSDLSSSIERLKQANIDILYHSGYNADTNLLWKQAADLNLYVPAVVGNGTAYVLPSFIEAVGQQTALGIVNVDQPYYNINSKFASGMKNIINSYKEEYGKTPQSQLPASTYSSMQILKRVINKASSFEIGPFEEAALSISQPVGSLANSWGVEFDKKHHRNQKVTVAATQWQHDKFDKDVYHPKKHPNDVDPYGVFPDKAAVEYTKIKNIPRPKYT